MAENDFSLSLHTAETIEYFRNMEKQLNSPRTEVAQRIRSVSSMSVSRKLLAITLLALLGMPLLQPLLALTGASETNLPACCRRHGIHHCWMSMAERSQVISRTPRFLLPIEKCPYYPASIPITSSSYFVPPIAQAIFAELVAYQAIAVRTDSKRRISFHRSHQKRGPPSFSFTLAAQQTR